MSKFLSLTVVLMVSLVAFAAQAGRLSVRSFAPDYSDLSASTHGRNDLNGRTCALVIVELPVEGCRFQGNIIGDVEFFGSQYWVYLTEGTRMLKIMCPGSEAFMADLIDAEGNLGVASKVTYHLYLDGYDTGTNGSKSSGPKGNYLTLSITPKTNLVVKINGELQPVDNGEVMTFLNSGTYKVTVEAPGYESYSSNVAIDDSSKKHLDINLQALMATLTVKCATEGATISINGKERGVGTVTTELTPGKYLVEARKDGYRTHSEDVTVANRDRRTVSLPALMPFYGAIDISYRPMNATVTFDDKQVGVTPLLLREVLIGNHKVTIAKEGYENFTTTVTVAEGETASLSGTLFEKPQKSTIEELKKKYDEVDSFSEGLARVKINGKCGFVNQAGELAIPFKYDDAGSFTEGLAGVKINGKYGFVNKSGEVAIPVIYDRAYSFNEGLAHVELNGKKGFINKTGETVIPLIYDITYHLISEGLAGVKINGKYGFVDKTGKVVIPLKYDEVGNFSEGLARVKLNGKCGFINKTGDVAIPLKYDEVGYFSEGLADVKLNDKWGFVNKFGEVVIPFKYDGALSFREGLVSVILNRKCGYINKAGEMVIPLKYDKADWFSKGLASVKLNGKWGYINKSGQEVIPLIYDIAYPLSEGLSRVKLNGKYGFVNKTGEVVIPLKYDNAKDFREGLADVELNGKRGYIDKQGNFTPK